MLPSSIKKTEPSIFLTTTSKSAWSVRCRNFFIMKLGLFGTLLHILISYVVFHLVHNHIYCWLFQFEIESEFQDLKKIRFEGRR